MERKQGVKGSKVPRFQSYDDQNLKACPTDPNLIQLCKIQR